jgi:hypothetical protein
LPVHRVTTASRSGSVAWPGAVVSVGWPVVVVLCVIDPAGSRYRGSPRCPERAWGAGGRNRRGTAGGVTPRAVGAGTGGAPRAGSGSCGGADARVDDPGAGMPVLTWRDHGGTSVAGVRGCGPWTHAVAPWTPKVAGFSILAYPAIASRSQQPSADHHVGAGRIRGGTRMAVASHRTGHRGSQGPNWVRTNSLRPREYLIVTSQIKDRARSANHHTAVVISGTVEACS